MVKKNVKEKVVKRGKKTAAKGTPPEKVQVAIPEKSEWKSHPSVGDVIAERIAALRNKYMQEGKIVGKCDDIKIRDIALTQMISTQTRIHELLVLRDTFLEQGGSLLDSTISMKWSLALAE